MRYKFILKIFGIVISLSIIFFLYYTMIKTPFDMSGPSEMRIVVVDDKGIEQTFDGLLNYQTPNMFKDSYSITTFTPDGKEVIDTKTFLNPESFKVVSGVAERNQRNHKILRYALLVMISGGLIGLFISLMNKTTGRD